MNQPEFRVEWKEKEIGDETIFLAQVYQAESSSPLLSGFLAQTSPNEYSAWFEDSGGFPFGEYLILRGAIGTARQILQTRSLVKARDLEAVQAANGILEQISAREAEIRNAKRTQFRLASA